MCGSSKKENGTRLSSRALRDGNAERLFSVKRVDFSLRFVTVAHSRRDIPGRRFRIVKPSGTTQFPHYHTRNQDDEDEEDEENFFDICTRNGMDPRFIFCIGIHESYYGTSNIANEKGNFFGWGAYDWDPGGSAFEFADMSEGIEDVSSGLARNYVSPDGQWYQWIIDKGYDPTTVEGIGCRYASDDNWANAVKQHMTNIFGCTGGTSYNDGEATEMQAKIVEIASSQDTLGNAGGMCQAWVADVYERAGQSRISSCCASSAADKWMVSTEQNNIPLGAAVYGYSNPTVYCDCGRDAGHVGIYIGNGQVASNVGGIRIESLDSWIASFGWKGWGWNGGTDYSK